MTWLLSRLILVSTIISLVSSQVYTSTERILSTPSHTYEWVDSECGTIYTFPQKSPAYFCRVERDTWEKECMVVNVSQVFGMSLHPYTKEMYFIAGEGGEFIEEANRYLYKIPGNINNINFDEYSDVSVPFELISTLENDPDNIVRGYTTGITFAFDGPLGSPTLFGINGVANNEFEEVQIIFTISLTDGEITHFTNVSTDDDGMGRSVAYSPFTDKLYTIRRNLDNRKAQLVTIDPITGDTENAKQFNGSFFNYYHVIAPYSERYLLFKSFLTYYMIDLDDDNFVFVANYPLYGKQSPANKGLMCADIYDGFIVTTQGTEGTEEEGTTSAPSKGIRNQQYHVNGYRLLALFIVAFAQTILF